PKRPLRILTPAEYDALHTALAAPRWRLLVDVAFETGIRWGELAELRVHDLHLATRVLTISRAVVELRHPDPDGQCFRIKQYLKNTAYRQLHLTTELTHALLDHLTEHHLASDDLILGFPAAPPRDDTNPSTGGAAPEGHGTASRYSAGCRRDAIATYRRHRRALGHDRPAHQPRSPANRHLARNWFRKTIWAPALHLTHRVRIHDLRHTNAS
ncbi:MULTISPECIES: tyrosine-type recombinase/integrase, partial [unclassified Saccharopolyspora]